MGYEWLIDAMTWATAQGVDPEEVAAMLNGPGRKWPRPGFRPDGSAAVTIWGRTPAGKGVIVLVRQLSGFDWQIINATAMTPQQLDEFTVWEARS